jgi:Fe-S oxidoreductase
LPGLKKKLFANCIECGACITSCPIFLEGPYKDTVPEDMIEKLLAVLKDGAFSEEAYFTAFSCMECEMCTGICPQGIKPLLLRQLVRNKLFAMGNTPPGGLAQGSGPSPLEILHSIQIKPSEARWLREAPPSPEKKDVVVLSAAPAWWLRIKILPSLMFWNIWGLISRLS